MVSQSAAGTRQVQLEADGNGGWRVAGDPGPPIDGCLDVDLEASAFTNAFPVHRLGLNPGERAEAPAAYVRAPDLAVERLEQSYIRLDDDGPRSRYDYKSPAFEFTAVLDYPGIAVRVA